MGLVLCLLFGQTCFSFSIVEPNVSVDSNRSVFDLSRYGLISDTFDRIADVKGSGRYRRKSLFASLSL